MNANKEQILLVVKVGTLCTIVYRIHLIMYCINYKWTLETREWHSRSNDGNNYLI